MTRTASQFYKEDADMQFQWATSDNDLFDREYDIYRLSQAVERHTHNGTTKGLPVEALAGSAIGEGSYAPNSIPNGAYKDGSIYGGKIQAGGITDDRLQYLPLHKTGDTMTGDLRMSRGGTDYGLIGFGTRSDVWLLWDGQRWIWNNPIPGSRIYIQSDVDITRPGAPGQGYLFLASATHYIGWNGSQLVFDGYPIHNDSPSGGAHVGVPVGGVIILLSMGEFNGLGARWQRVTQLEGRFPIGNGAGWVNDGTAYGDINWMPSAGLGVNKGDMAVSGGSGTLTGTASGSGSAAVGAAAGGLNLDPRGHTHPVSITAGSMSLTGNPALTGTNTTWVPACYGVVFARRVS